MVIDAVFVNTKASILGELLFKISDRGSYCEILLTPLFINDSFDAVNIRLSLSVALVFVYPRQRCFYLYRDINFMGRRINRQIDFIHKLVPVRVYLIIY